MDPKKNQETSDNYGIRKTLDNIQAKLSPLMKLMEEIRRRQNEQRGNRVNILGKRVDDMEQQAALLLAASTYSAALMSAAEGQGP